MKEYKFRLWSSIVFFVVMLLFFVLVIVYLTTNEIYGEYFCHGNLQPTDDMLYGFVVCILFFATVGLDLAISDLCLAIRNWFKARKETVYTDGGQ